MCRCWSGRPTSCSTAGAAGDAGPVGLPRAGLGGRRSTSCSDRSTPPPTPRRSCPGWSAASWCGSRTRRYHLHPVDRDYARRQAPGRRARRFRQPRSPWPPCRPAPPTTTPRSGRPRESWRTLEDIRPQLAEFELRCATGDYDTAATVLGDIDFDYLQLWGHYRTLIDLHETRHTGRITRPRPRTPPTSAAWGSAIPAWVSTGGPSSCTPRRWPSPARSATARARAPPWAASGSATPAWVSTGGPSSCTPRRWPSPARSATARARAPRWATWALPPQPGRVPAGHRPAHPGAGHRPRHRRPPGRGDRAGLPGPGLAGVRRGAPGGDAARAGGEHRRHHR